MKTAVSSAITTSIFVTVPHDCITYGFAIGDSGSEKSKVITDTLQPNRLCFIS
ncbi:MAG: hypothetical protein R3E31_19130 [Chloroflexota bacterium]